MSSAAPSALGTPAPAPPVASEPTAAPAPAAETKRQIKPIPPKGAAPAGEAAEGGDGVDGTTKPRGLPGVRPSREVLPGVATTGEGIELPVRGPDGRFVSRAEAEAAYEAELRGEGLLDAEDGAAEPAPAPKLEAEPPKPDLPNKPGDQKIKFLGQDTTVAEAEQRFRSLQGMHDPIAKKLAQTEKDRDYGYQAANAWEQEARNARAELEQAKSGGVRKTGTAQSNGQVPAGNVDLDGLVDAIDYDAFELIAHDPQGGTRVAGRYLAQQVLNTVLTQIIPAVKAELMQQVEPVLNTTREAWVANEVGQVINTVAQYSDLEGKPAFPELMDEATLAEVGAVWHDSMPEGVDPKAWARAAVTPQGLINAIALYRLLKGLPAEARPAVPATAPAEVAPGAAALAETDEGQRVGMGRPSRTDTANPEAKFFRKAFDEPLFDKQLGFSRNRRA